MSIYEIQVKDAIGKDVSLSDYNGKVLLIVNTASKCGFAPQFDDLQALYEKYRDKGLEILAFPCDQFANQEPNSDEEIQKICQVNLGLEYKVFAKLDVNGDTAHPLYKHLRKEKPGIGGDAVKWNFTKFLVDRNGKVVSRYAPITKPAALEPAISRLLGN